MSHLRNALADYLTMRRALGYKMDKTERLLGQFENGSDKIVHGSGRMMAAAEKNIATV